MHLSRLTAPTMAAVFFLATTSWAVNWDVTYEGDVLPDASTPTWIHGAAGGTSNVSGGILRLTSGTGAANSWDRTSGNGLITAALDPAMMGSSNATFQFNDPDTAGETWTNVSGKAFTIEWRMKVNGPSTLTPGGDQVGMKLEYGEYPTGREAKFEWYYDAVNHRLPNNRYGWGSHAGKTGPEGSEGSLSNDGFDNIQLGEWHTYKVTSVNMNGRWHRELWLDGNYVGRWWDESNASGISPEIKIRTNTTKAGADVEFDYVRYANDPDGRYVRPMVLRPQTLLLNQSFEEAAGSRQAWFGRYARSAGTTVHNLTPNTMDGASIYELSVGDPGAPINDHFYQTVPIRSGETVTFAGSGHVGPDMSVTNTATVNLWDGPVGTGALLASQTLNQSNAGAAWTDINLSGTSTAGAVTVEVAYQLSVPNWGPVAVVHFDDFRLTSSIPCDAQPTVTGISPVGTAHDVNPSVTISGTNLDGVTGVKLVQMSSGTVLTGTITGQSSTTVWATFPTIGSPLGKYNVVVEKASCITQQLIDGFTIVCGNPTTFTDITPTRIEPPGLPYRFTITGTNLAPLLTGGVSLVFSTDNSQVLQGTNLVMNGNNLEATFDFTDADLGAYDVRGTRADSCATATPLLGKVIYMPGTQENLMGNSDFETGALDPWTSGCLKQVGVGEDFGLTAHSGSWYMRAVSNYDVASCTAEQPITLVNGPGQYDLTLSYYAWMWDTSYWNNPGLASYAKGEIVVDGTAVAEVSYNSVASTQTVWVPVAVTWSGQVNSSLMVRMTLQGDGRGDDPAGNPRGWGMAAIDDVMLTIPPGSGCGKPFADTDNDQDVDQDDFGQFQLCFTGDMPGTATRDCRCFDRDKDNDVDQMDLAAFIRCADTSGPTIMADVNCENPPPQ